MEFNKAFFDCLRALRRRLRQEQGLDIHFDEPKAVARMIAASQRSEEPETQRLGQRLAELGQHSPVPAPQNRKAAPVPQPESSFVSADFLASNQRYAGPLRG